jgi:protein-S-isoprenylcysteine O-methyltransferase Ste14
MIRKPTPNQKSAIGNQKLSWLLVFLQFAALALIAFTGPLFAPSPLLLALELAGLALGAWAVLAQGFDNFGITPDPVAGAHLVTRGPYKLIRHPMYAALLLTTLPLVVAAPSLLRAALWLLLLADLVVKLNYEEGMLVEEFKAYTQYKKHTYRLIPFVY